MSYVTEVFMNRQIAQAAEALDLLEACKSHRLANADASKFRLLADEIKRASSRFSELATQQSVMSTDEFFKKALERAAVIKHERAVLMQARKEKREREAREREEFLKDLQLMGVAA